MAGKREVKIYITADASGVDKAAGQIESRLGGLSGKMKGLVGGLSLVALGRGALSAANDFQDAAIAANDFATASGLTVEQASRWQEVAGDIGVESNTLSSAVGKLSKGLGSNATKWAKYGVAVAKSADGQVDANKTFLNAVDVLHKIEDPFERAKVGAELFGRSWTDLAPLIELGADELTVALAGVGDAQVINPEEVEKAKRFRDTMDGLNDSVGGLKFSIAEGLLPVISTFAGWLSTLDPKMVTLGLTIGAGVIVVAKLSGAITGVSAAMTVMAAHPVMVGVGLVLVGLALIVKNWDEISAAIGSAIAKVEEFSAKIAGPLTGPFKAINNALGGNFGKGGAQLNESNPYVKQVLRGRATGGWSSSPFIAGERGPELVVPRPGGAFTSNASATARMGGRSGDTFIVQAAPGMSEIDLARAVMRQRDRADRSSGRRDWAVA